MVDANYSDDYADFGRYAGGTAEGFRDGRGKFQFANPYFSYDGEWRAGQMHGAGTLSMADGSSYEGAFHNGEMSGFGLKRWADGGSYSGQFVEGELHGQGTFIGATGEQYEGAYERNARHGEGTLAQPDGRGGTDTYRGAFVRHRRSGRGAMAYADGGAYEGDWLMDRRNGVGRMVWAAGDEFDGEWAADAPHGEGRYRHPAGYELTTTFDGGVASGAADRFIVARYRTPAAMLRVVGARASGLAGGGEFALQLTLVEEAAAEGGGGDDDGEVTAHAAAAAAGADGSAAWGETLAFALAEGSARPPKLRARVVGADGGWQAAAEVELLTPLDVAPLRLTAPGTVHVALAVGDDLEATQTAGGGGEDGGVSLELAFEIEEETPPPPPDKVEEAFRQFDDNDNGRIEKKELRKALKHLGVDATHVTKALKGALDKYDADGTGSLDLLEFRLFVRGLPGDRVEGAFKQFDANRSGTIELRELKKALKSLGVAATSKAVTAALAKYDDDGSKQLDLGEFTALVNDVVATPELLDDEVKAEAEAVVLDAVAGAELPPLSIRYVLEVEKKVADVAAADADAADGAAAEGGDGAAEEAAAAQTVRVVEDARRESRRRIQPTLKRPEGWEPPPDEAPPAEGEEGAEAEPPPPPPTEFYLEAIFSASGRAVLRGAVVPAAVPPGEWTLHLTDVTEGAAALQLPAVPPVVIPLTVAATPEEEEEY